MSTGSEAEEQLPPAEEQRGGGSVSLERSLPEETLPSQQDRHHPLSGRCQRFPGQTRAENTDPGSEDHSDLLEVNPADEGAEAALPQHQGQCHHPPECVAREETEPEISESQVQHRPLPGGCPWLDCPEEEQEKDRGNHHHPAGTPESLPGKIVVI